MDCSQTQDGWFEFTTVYSLGGSKFLKKVLSRWVQIPQKVLLIKGGEDGEVAISQGDCLGEVGGTAPFTSDKHIAR